MTKRGCGFILTPEQHGVVVALLGLAAGKLASNQPSFAKQLEEWEEKIHAIAPQIYEVAI